MTDLISRQAVLDWLNDEWDGMVLSVFDGIRALPSAQSYTEAEIQKIQDLEQAQFDTMYELGKQAAESHWIPCSERLPESIRPVIVTWKTPTLHHTISTSLESILLGRRAIKTVSGIGIQALRKICLRNMGIMTQRNLMKQSNV